MEHVLKDKVAVVTGGTRGIGKAIVLALARSGAKVVCTYVKSDEAAAGLVDEIRGFRGTIEALKADSRNIDEMKRVVGRAVDMFGRLDIVVNNAGVVKDKALMMMEPQDWQEVIDTNLTGCFNMARSCIVTMMKQKSGAIVNISSVAGLTGTPRQVNYSSAKAGIIGLTRSLAKEVAAYNIRVNAVAPGYVETDMTRDLKRKEDLCARIPLCRFGKPEEVAKAVLFLVSDRAGYITGQVLTVDGGLVIK